MYPVFRLFSLLILSSLLAACASLPTQYEKPEVSITSLSLDRNEQSPVFNIGLRIVNPNRVALPIKGMTYQLDIEGHKILSGAKADFPEIGAYQTTDVVIQASPDLFGTLKLLNQILTSPQDHFDYALKAKLDVGQFIPLINIVETGRLDYSEN